MALIAKDLGSLTGGVSQQAATLRLSSQCEEQINFRASLVNGLQSRKGIKRVCTVTQSEGAFYPIDRDDDGRYNLIVNSSGVTVTDANGNIQTVNYEGTARSYLTTTNKDWYNIFKVLTLADCTYILNTERTAKLTDDIYSPWVNQALVFIKQVAATTTYTLTIDGTTRSVGYGGTNSDTGLPDLYINGTMTQEDVHFSTTSVASYLAQGFSSSTYTITQMGSVLWIRRANGASFSIGLADSRGDDYSYLITSKTQDFSDLPTVAPDGYIARIIGDTASNADDYFVMFTTDNGSTMGKGTWSECAEPGSSCVIDASTMPHVLVHNADGTWTFKEQEWAEKLVGDEDTNPTPSFIDQKLRNIFLFSNRLCFLTEDLLCMSASADFENFWNETATTITDADPIFLSASIDTVADLYDFGIQDEALLIFGSHDQYKLNTVDPLSPKTAALTSVASNAYTKGTGIASSGSQLYFGHQKGKYYSVREFGTSAYTGSKEATEVTAHVPNYIPFTGTLRLCGTDTTNTLTVWTTDSPDTLFMYQFYVSGTNKLQSAWYKYTINGAEIKGAFYREETLWLYFTKSAAHFIATLDMAEAVQDATEPSLDLAAKYTAEEATNTFTIPTWYDADNLMALTETKAGVFQIVDIVSCEAGKLVLDKALANLTIGEKYKRSYIFSTPYVTQKSGNSQTTYLTGRWQLQTLTLYVIDSGFFTITVTPTYDDEAEGCVYEYSGMTSGTQTTITGEPPVESGERIVPIRLRNTETKVEIAADNHLPQAIIDAIWQGNYITKVRQM